LNDINNRHVVPSASSKYVKPEGLLPSSVFSANTFADALGSLIAERVKQDAEVIALQKLAKSMKNLDAQESKPLTAGFPSTMRYLDTFKTQPVQANDWSILQSDFKVDMVALPHNLPAFLDAVYDPTVVSEPRYLTYLAASAGGAIIKNGRQPYDLIDSLQAGSSNFQSAHPGGPPFDFSVALDAVAIVSHALTKNGSNTWRSATDLNAFLFPAPRAALDLDSLNLLLGLSFARDAALYKKLNDWLASQHLTALQEADSVQLGAVASALGGVAGVFEKITVDVLNIPVGGGSVADAQSLAKNIYPLGAATLNLIAIFDPTLQNDPSAHRDNSAQTVALAKMKLVSDELATIVDIIAQLTEKEYPAAIGNMVTLLRLYICTDHSGALAAFLSEDGPFIAAVAGAKTPADVKTAFDEYALPATSYLQIERQPFSVTLNSYFGGTVGAETLLGGLGGTGTARTRAHAGFTAPVGLDFNWGKVSAASGEDNGKFFQTGSWSLFVPILDVGAVASWRLGSGGGQVSSITWANIVAPGVFAVWSKRGSPFSILVGAQYGPELTKISAGGGNTIEKAALQFPSIGFTFNIPIFNVYQTPPKTLQTGVLPCDQP
jgi:hypothetical protein